MRKIWSKKLVHRWATRKVNASLSGDPIRFFKNFKLFSDHQLLFSLRLSHSCASQLQSSMTRWSYLAWTSEEDILIFISDHKGALIPGRPPSDESLSASSRFATPSYSEIQIGQTIHDPQVIQSAKEKVGTLQPAKKNDKVPINSS